MGKRGCASQEGRALFFLTSASPLSRRPVLDEATLPLAAACGVNIPSPDAVTPARAAAGVWTWAEGQPFSQPDPPPPPVPSNPFARAAAAAAAWFRRVVLRRPDPPPPLPGTGLCGVLSSADGRWVARPCSEPGRPAACRSRGLGRAWVLPSPAASGAVAACPPGTDWAAPRDGRDAGSLVDALAKAGGGLDGAWLPVQGMRENGGWSGEQWDGPGRGGGGA